MVSTIWKKYLWLTYKRLKLRTIFFQFFMPRFWFHIKESQKEEKNLQGEKQAKRSFTARYQSGNMFVLFIDVSIAKTQKVIILKHVIFESSTAETFRIILKFIKSDSKEINKKFSENPSR